MTSPISQILPALFSGAADGIDGSPSTGSSSATGGASGSSGSGDVNLGGINSNTFLQLLVSQLTHQDPMNPTDSTTYITEEAEFSMVQSMNTLAKQNSQILQSQQMQQATGFIGKNVTYVDANGIQGVGVVASASPGNSSTGAVVRVGTAQIPITSITSVFADNADPTATGSTTSGSTTSGSTTSGSTSSGSTP
ncbi:MAG: flagellar hook capping FlgD N-terminal domain-containing protein [Acidothermaceae bacterium]